MLIVEIAAAIYVGLLVLNVLRADWEEGRRDADMRRLDRIRRENFLSGLREEWWRAKSRKPQAVQRSKP